jgi:hypothetical protein
MSEICVEAMIRCRDGVYARTAEDHSQRLKRKDYSVLSILRQGPASTHTGPTIFLASGKFPSCPITVLWSIRQSVSVYPLRTRFAVHRSHMYALREHSIPQYPRFRCSFNSRHTASRSTVHEGQEEAGGIQVASGVALTVFLAPKNIRMYYLTEDQLESVASLNLINAVCLAFFGICIGSVIAFYTTLKTAEIKDPSTHAIFIALAIGSGCLAVFFGIVLGVGCAKSLVDLKRWKKIEPTVAPITPIVP